MHATKTRLGLICGASLVGVACNAILGVEELTYDGNDAMSGAAGGQDGATDNGKDVASGNGGAAGRGGMAGSGGAAGSGGTVTWDAGDARADARVDGGGDAGTEGGSGGSAGRAGGGSGGAGGTSCTGDTPDWCSGSSYCTNLQTSVQDCGACGAPCSAANGIVVCATGVCSMSSCVGTYKDCSANENAARDGCETDVESSVAHCGSCSTPCGTFHAVTGCLGGVCSISKCDLDHANCSANENAARDGCETDIAQDLNNCGGCGERCSTFKGSASCTSGACAMSSCDAGYANCSADENAARNGCETHIAGDANHCGDCTKVCPGNWAHAAPVCISGNCSHVCDSGWGNCDGQSANGCEADLSNDGHNCSSCGHSCVSIVCRNQVCLTTARYGNTGTGTGNVNFSGGFLAGIQIWIPNACVLTGFGVVFAPTAASHNMYLGLYKDQAGSPTTLMGTVGSSFLASAGGVEVPIAPVPVDIPAGNYWILGVWDGTAMFATNSSSNVTWLYSGYTFGALPATAPVGMSSTQEKPPNLYVIVAQ